MTKEQQREAEECVDDMLRELGLMEPVFNSVGADEDFVRYKDAVVAFAALVEAARREYRGPKAAKA